MTPRQIELARHALGLPNSYRRSYRNRFVVQPGGADYIAWVLLAGDGHAERRLGGEMDWFFLTRKGAEAVLRRGEKLDPENFPSPSGRGAP